MSILDGICSQFVELGLIVSLKLLSFASQLNLVVILCLGDILLEHSAGISPLHQLELIHGLLLQDVLHGHHVLIQLRHFHLTVLQFCIATCLHVVDVLLHLLCLIIGGLLYLLLVVQDLVPQLEQLPHLGSVLESQLLYSCLLLSKLIPELLAKTIVLSTTTHDKQTNKQG